MKIYVFGKRHDHIKAIKAKNIEMAIKLFKIEVLFPEEYVQKKFIESSKYNSDLNRYVYKIKPDATIPIYEFPNKKNVYYYGEIIEKKMKPKKKIFLNECINVDFSQLKNIPLLPFDKENEQDAKNLLNTQKELLNSSKIPVKDLSTYTKIEIRNMTDLIKLKQVELEQQRQELYRLESQLSEELNKKRKMIYVIETYLGLQEEILQLKKGKPTIDKEPISIYQMKLYMDEEIGLWEDGGLDLQSIEVFDNWLLKNDNYKRFLYKEKSICAFQVRRFNKNYTENTFDNFLLNQGNENTYLLIRNGENLYRIWSDIYVQDRLFPIKNEYEKILNEHGGSFLDSQKNEIQRKHESYMYGFTAVQGLIERTDIFGNYFRDKVNLLKINGFTEKEINLIRDGEPEMWLTEGKLSWNDFITLNRKSISEGTRIVFTRTSNLCLSENTWRVEPYVTSTPPARHELYIVKKEKYPYHGTSFVIYYNPGDDVWDGKCSVTRKRRVPYRLYSDEMINYDTITLEDCEYYENNRYERKHYLDILPTMHWIKNLKQKEKDLEDNFVRFIKPQITKKITDEEIRKAVKWWKLKNKWKRELLANDTKAVRMILRKLNKEN